MKVICVIPARYASTRFPGKPLATILGKPMIQWVYSRAERSKHIQATMVATDDLRIYNTVESFGGKAVLTNGDYSSGTDRIADAVHNLKFDIVVNLQGDEPLIRPETIDAAVETMLSDDRCQVSSAMVRIDRREGFLSPHIVKVVCDKESYALYFSRSPIPSLARSDQQDTFFGFKHLGLYVYRKEALFAFPKMQPTALEQIEKLEQLRFLENGYRIKIAETPFDSIGVDTQENLEKVTHILEKEKE